MADILSVESLRAAYEYLASTPPFIRWNLPDGHDVVFRVVKSTVDYGWYDRDRAGRHVIAVSRRSVGGSDSLMRTIAHEAIHLHQADVKMETSAEHNAAFWRLAAQVCRAHGWNVKEF